MKEEIILAPEIQIQESDDLTKESFGRGPGQRVTIVGMLVNIGLIALKLWAGLLASSQALIADAAHSLADLFTDLVALMGLRWGSKAPDEEHPFGHARIETITGMGMGIILFIMAAGIAYSSVGAISGSVPSDPSIIAVIAASVSILLKEILYRYTISIGKRLRSLVLIGNAWHHRTDALSSVAVLLGVGAVYINPSWHKADAYAALAVSTLIAKVGSSLIWTAFKEVVDTAPDKKILSQLQKSAMTIPGVRQAHDLKARYSGPHIFVEIHIVVESELTVREGHNIARLVKNRLMDSVKDVSSVIVHVDPDLKAEMKADSRPNDA